MNRVGRGFAASACATCALASSPAFAQATPKVSSHASASQVEVGEQFTIELKALADQGSGTPSDPELRAPAGIQASAPTVSQQTYAQFGGGRSSVQVGIGATWTLVASAPGHFVIPGPSVRWNGQRLSTPAIGVDVVPSTGLHPSPNQNPLNNPFQNPFLMPGGPSFNFPFPLGNDQRDDPDEVLGNGAPELALPNAPDSQVFLHAVVDKKNVVVGEQASISFYVYHRVDFEMTERHEAPLADFLRVPLLKNPGSDPPIVAVAGGHRFTVRLLDKIGIFPLHAGDLHTGSMSARFVGRRIGAHVLRESEDIVLHVTEPPKDGRPAGYQLGDVGRFDVSAIVEPRHIEQGGATSVKVRVTGTGNLPASLRVPERVGVEWLDPEKNEQQDINGGVVGGSKTFGYVVKIKESGAVDLGTIELPFWDPGQQKYVVAKAPLGVIDVDPTTPKIDLAARDAKAPDPFASVAGARRALGAWTPRSTPPWLEGNWIWGGIAAPPLAAILALGAARAGSSMKKRRAADKNAPSTLASKAMREAAAAKKKGDAKAQAAALERALRFTIEDATGLKSSGVAADALEGELEARDLSNDLAKRLVAILLDCEAARFDPLAEVKDLDARVKKAIDDLEERR